MLCNVRMYILPTLRTYLHTSYIALVVFYIVHTCNVVAMYAMYNDICA